MLRQYEVVRVCKLLRSPSAYNDWRVNQRSPKVGDVGTIVEILGAPPESSGCYVVESSDSNGMTIWLAEFGCEELEAMRN